MSTETTQKDAGRAGDTPHQAKDYLRSLTIYPQLYTVNAYYPDDVEAVVEGLLADNARLRSLSPSVPSPARSFDELVEKDPETGKIPAVEVAKLALNLQPGDDTPEVNHNLGTEDGPHYSPVVVDYLFDGFKQQVLIAENYQVDAFIEGDMMPISNQPAIVDYLRSTGFLPSPAVAAPATVGGGAEAWVDVNERLPELNGGGGWSIPYIVAQAGETLVDTYRYSKVHGWCLNGSMHKGKNITHWHDWPADPKSLRSPVQEAPAGQWISVEERLPQDGQRVLISNGETCHVGGIINDDEDGPSWVVDAGTYGEDYYGLGTYSNWMPLPAAPAAQPTKEKEGEGE
jgi:hypothetical protein